MQVSVSQLQRVSKAGVSEAGVSQLQRVSKAGVSEPCRSVCLSCSVCLKQVCLEHAGQCVSAAACV